MIAFIALLAALNLQEHPTVPVALRSLMDSRAAVQTARVEYSSQDHSRGLPERRFTSRVAGGSVLYECHGDDKGIVVPGSDGARGSYLALATPDQLWRMQQLDVRGDWFPRTDTSPGLPNPVAFGLLPGSSNTSLDAALRAIGVGFSARESDESGLKHVVLEDGARRTDLWIDPQRGWNPVRVRFQNDGVVAWEVRSQLAKFGDRWFPELIETIRPRTATGEIPAYTIRVSELEVNAADHPKTLGPADIGVDVGREFLKHDADGKPVEIAFFDGAKLTSSDDFHARLRRGELKFGPNYRKALAQLDRESKKLEETQDSNPAYLAFKKIRLRPVGSWDWRDFEDSWSAYTERQVKLHQMSLEQAEAARRILRDCRERAAAHIRAHRAEYEQIESRVTAFEESNASADTPREADRLAKAFAELHAPIDEIFESQLKPRIDALLTRDQRKRADEMRCPVPSSGPATNAPSAGAP